MSPAQSMYATYIHNDAAFTGTGSTAECGIVPRNMHAL